MHAFRTLRVCALAALVMAGLAALELTPDQSAAIAEASALSPEAAAALAEALRLADTDPGVPVAPPATDLAPGDIALIQIDLTRGTDRFSFVALRALPAGTQIRFTDQGWTGTGFRTSPGTETAPVIWSAPNPNGIPAGGVVSLTTLPRLSQTNQGDQVIAFQQNGATTTFLHAITISGTTAGWNANATNEQTSRLPTGLVNGTTALAFPFRSPMGNVDSWRYAGPTSGTPAQVLANIQTVANWRTTAVTVPATFAVYTGLTLNALDVDEGASTIGIVTRQGSTTGAFTVAIASDDTTEATVPAGVTIPTMLPFWFFTITGQQDGIVDGDRTATITVSAGGLSGSDPMIVRDTTPLTLTLAVADVAEGGSAIGSVTRNGDFGDLTVTLASSDTSEALVPASVTIVSGQSSATFAITGQPDGIVDGSQSVTITATTPVASTAQVVTVADSDAGGGLVLTLDVPDVAEGATATGTVTRNGTAGALVVALSSDDTSEATVPADVTIAAGASSATFVVSGANDDLVDGSQTATITASSGSATASDGLLVTDTDAAPALMLSVPDVFEGQTRTGNVGRIAGPTAPAVTVFLASSDTGEATVPASVHFGVGQRDAMFALTGVADGLLDGSQPVTITASAGTASATQVVNVLDADGAPALTVTVNDVTEGQVSSGTVSRNNAGAALDVTVGSSDTGEATVPLTVTIPAGESSRSFTITGVPDAAVDPTRTVTITVSAPGYAPAQDELSVFNADELTTLTLVLPPSVAEGATAQATLQRDGLGDQPLTVNLTSLDTTEATVPASVAFAFGETTIAFTVTGQDDALLDGTVTVTIEAQGATTNLVSGTVDVTDTDVPSLVLTLDVPDVAEGATATGTVTRNGTTGALVVGLSSDDISEATVAADVTIAAGASSATFVVSGANDDLVDGSQTVTITASSGGATASDTLLVTDADVAPTLTLSVPDVFEGQARTGHVNRIAGPTSPAVTVFLSSGDTGEATVPASVLFGIGQRDVPFTISGVTDGLVDGSQPVTITASAGTASATRVVNVLDADGAPALTLTVNDVTEGQVSSGTVSRNNAGAALDVTVGSSDTGEATVPVTVTIPAGESSRSFTITGVSDAAVDPTQTVTITVSAPGYAPAQDELSVFNADVLTTLTLVLPPSVAEGATAQATLQRDGLGEDPLTVSLTSLDTTEATVPASVAFAFGETSIAFTVTGQDDALVDGTVTVTIEAQGATTNLVSGTVDVTDTDVPSLVLTLDVPDVAEGATATGTVTRNGTTGALLVTLSSSDTSEATVPADVTIAAGASSATFIVSGADDDLVDGAQTVTITASSASATVSDGLLVTDTDVAPSLTLTLSDVFEGQTRIGIVNRIVLPSSPAVTVFLSSSDTGEATVPTSVVFPAGQRDAMFTLTGVTDGIVDGAQPVTITASAGSASTTRTVNVLDVDGAPVLSLTVNDVTEGQVSSGIVSRNNVGPALDVTLGSSDTGEATVPLTVTIPAGESARAFTITGVPDAALDPTQSVVITASAPSYAPAQDELSVFNADELTTLTLVLPASVAEGATAQATLQRDGFGDQALTVNLTSLDTTEATVPASISFGFGETSIAFTVTGQDDALLDGTVTVTIQAQGGTTDLVSGTVDVTDTDLPTLVLTLDVPDVAEGATATGTVTRNGTTGALVVGLSSDDTSEATVPADVTITAGASSATFVVSGANDDLVDGSQAVTITASSGVATASDGLLVTDIDPTPTLSLSVPDVFEGQTRTGTVNRIAGPTSPAVTVFLSSSDTGEATVPASVVFGVGQRDVPFAITGVTDGVVDGSQPVTIAASAGTAIAKRVVNVLDADGAPALTLTVNDVTEGQVASGTVSRNNAAAALDVTVGSSDTGEATVPLTVTIPAGESSRSFTITGVPDASVDPTQTVTITVSAPGYAPAQDELSVFNADVLTTLTLVLPPSVAEGATAQATLQRDGLGEDPLTVDLASLDTTEATVPASVSFGFGETSVTFAVTAVADAVVDGTQSATIQASGATTTTAIGAVDITDATPLALTVALNDVIEGQSAPATVSRNGTFGNTVVALSALPGGEVTVPATVTIVAGQSSASFSVAGIADGATEGPETITVTATSGAASASDDLVITDAVASALTIALTTPASFLEPDWIRGTITRSTTVGSLAVTLSQVRVGGAADSRVFFTSATLTFPNGQSTLNWSAQARHNAADEGTVAVRITATSGVGSASVDVSIVDAADKNITVLLEPMLEGDNSVTYHAVMTRNYGIGLPLTVRTWTGPLSLRKIDVPETVTFPANSESTTIAVTSSRANRLSEDDATTFVRLLSPFAPANTGSPLHPATNTDFAQYLLDDDTTFVLTLLSPVPGIVDEFNNPTAFSFRLTRRDKDDNEASPPFATDFVLRQDLTRSAALRVNLPESDTADHTFGTTVSIEANQSTVPQFYVGTNNLSGLQDPISTHEIRVIRKRTFLAVNSPLHTVVTSLVQVREDDGALATSSFDEEPPAPSANQ